MEEKIKVHIADDHKILIEGIIAVINTEENILVEGYSLTGKEVTEWSQNSSADILILDINMPELDGIEVLKFFKKKDIKIKTIILSSYDDVKLVEEMLALGAGEFTYVAHNYSSKKVWSYIIPSILYASYTFKLKPI